MAYLVLIAGFMLPASAAAQGQDTLRLPGGDDTVFRSGVDLISLNVTVTDGQDNFVTGLSADDFAVFEDGVQQELSFFAAADVRLDIAILIDMSASMFETLSTAQDAAIGFLQSLREGDRASVMGFSDGVELFQPFTEDLEKLRAAVRQTRASGATALYQAIYIALREFERLAQGSPDVRRQAVVLLSDGEDTASMIDFDTVQEKAKRIGVRIYTIYIISPWEAQRLEDGLHRGQFSTARFIMRNLAQETGARSFFAVDPSELTGVYDQIAEELSNMYALAYVSNNPRRDGEFRRVVVRVSQPEVRLRTRSGYFAERPAPTFFDMQSR